MWSTLTRALRTPPASNTPLPYLGLFTPARHKRTNANAPVRYRWWQKTLPALAPAVAATMPGRWAAPPAPAMMTRSPRDANTSSARK